MGINVYIQIPTNIHTNTDIEGEKLCTKNDLCDSPINRCSTITRINF